MPTEEKGLAPDNDPINLDQINKRWRVRRRLSIASFILLGCIVYRAIFFKIETAEDIIIASIYGLILIILVYIGGPIVDDYLQTKK